MPPAWAAPTSSPPGCSSPPARPRPRTPEPEVAHDRGGVAGRDGPTRHAGFSRRYYQRAEVAVVCGSLLPKGVALAPRNPAHRDLRAAWGGAGLRRAPRRWRADRPKEVALVRADENGCRYSDSCLDAQE